MSSFGAGKTKEVIFSVAWPSTQIWSPSPRDRWRAPLRKGSRCRPTCASGTQFPSPPYTCWAWGCLTEPCAVWASPNLMEATCCVQWMNPMITCSRCGTGPRRPRWWMSSAPMRLYWWPPSTPRTPLCLSPAGNLTSTSGPWRGAA
ncbi:EML2 isoform 2 [Pan troglodytes]|uniref:EML2 isoform 2 n=1 Tax=Pan troglodytes TaxID=9598 RepID=A0A2J8PYR5_PANTR|nr:EML2 isoform 2 [Pan troglodytes]